MAVVQMAVARAEPVSLDWARQAWAGLEGLALLREALTGPLAGRIAMVSSFGAESAVLLDMVASIDRRTPVVFLETGIQGRAGGLAAAGGRARHSPSAA